MNAATTRKPDQGLPGAAEKKTRLQDWLDQNGFQSVQLEAATGICRQSMTKIRGRREFHLRTMRRILRGARKLAGRPVQMQELFDLEPDEAP